MNLILLVGTISLFSVAVSDPALQGTMLFYPVSILVSSQLVGRALRITLVWHHCAFYDRIFRVGGRG